MKLQLSSFKKTIGLFIFTTLLLTLGCNNNESDNQNTQINQAELTNETITNKPKTPELDIHSAVISDNIEVVKQHILVGTDLNTKDPFGGSSPLITAALFGKSEIAKVLLEAGADINFVNNDGSNALHTAAFFCRPDIVQILLDNGIDKAAINNMNSTAYQSVAGPFKEVKPFYDMVGQSLAPFGLVLDDEYLQKTRPIIAEMLK